MARKAMYKILKEKNGHGKHNCLNVPDKKKIMYSILNVRLYVFQKIASRMKLGHTR